MPRPGKNPKRAFIATAHGKRTASRCCAGTFRRCRCSMPHGRCARAMSDCGLVQRGIADAVRAALIAAYATIRIGTSEDPSAQLGPLIDAKSVRRVNAIVEEAATYGKILVRGGPVLDGPLAAGAFYRPRSVEVEPLDGFLIQNEVFGPVQTFEMFDDEADAIKRANATEFGLRTAIFTKDEMRARRVGRAIRAGLIWTNCWAVLSEHFEQSGFKQSGPGMLCGPRAIEEFQELKVYATASPTP
jgi:betaine-aldehyde dehydrogenase